MKDIKHEGLNGVPLKSLISKIWGHWAQAILIDCKEGKRLDEILVTLTLHVYLD